MRGSDMMPAKPVERSRTAERNGETADGPILDPSTAPVGGMIVRGRGHGDVAHDELTRTLPCPARHAPIESKTR